MTPGHMEQNGPIRVLVAPAGSVEAQRAGVDFEGAFRRASAGMALIGLDGRWIEVNDAFCEVLALTRTQLAQTSLEEIAQRVEPGRAERRQLLAGQIASSECEVRYRHSTGREVWVVESTALVRDADGQPAHLIVQAQAISERRRSAERLDYLIDHDFLTGLLNRRRFTRELHQQIDRERRYGHGGALLLLDLDHFKSVNDRFGHQAGDQVLKAVAGGLRGRIRASDVLARIGGDEFAVLLPEASPEEATLVAETLVKGVRQHVAMLGEESLRITASVGVVLFDGLSDVELLAYADQAMYDAKDHGRDRVTVHAPGGDRRGQISTRLGEAERLRRALAEDRILLYCQPILELASGRISQYELLVRLEDEPGQEPLPPSAFLYAAERFGLIGEIDRWVLGRAIDLIAAHQRAGHELVLEVNLSGISLGDPTLATLVEERVRASGIEPSRLVLELTETAAVANLEEAQRFMSRLRALGCRFALDDFGSGFGSFYYLKHLPFDMIKIDGDFIRGLADNPTDRLVVQAIVTIAAGMGKKTIAEFVGDARTLTELRERGVDYAQGYHIGRPRLAETELAL